MATAHRDAEIRALGAVEGVEGPPRGDVSKDDPRVALGRQRERVVEPRVDGAPTPAELEALAEDTTVRELYADGRGSASGRVDGRIVGVVEIKRVAY